MTRDRFEQIVVMIENKFGEIEQRRETLTDGSGGFKDIVEFTGPLGRMKLEFTERARVVGEKTTYARRVGAEVGVEKQYDHDDLVGFMKAYVWQEERWTEMEAGKLVEG